MRSLYFSCVLFLTATGCERHDGAGAEFDSLLSRHQIDQIVAMPCRSDERTNVIVGERVSALLARLAATNRVTNTNAYKTVCGAMAFYERGVVVYALHYVPAEQLLAFRDYSFSFRDTNDIRSIFQ